MTSVTSYSKEKTDQLMAENIVNGTLAGDDLVLYKRDGTPVNVGNVRGAAGAAASGPDIAAAVAAAMADAPQGVLNLDTVGTVQSVSVTGGSWYTISGLSITDTIVDDRVYEIAGAGVISSSASSIGIDVEIRAGATFSSGTPIARETNFVYDSDKGIGFNLSRKIRGATGSFVGSKTFQIGFRASDDADIDILNDYSDGYISLVDLGLL